MKSPSKSGRRGSRFPDVWGSVFTRRRHEKLTAGVIEEAIAGWEGSTSTRIDALAVLSRLLDGAVRAHLVPLNQARLARRPKSESTTSLRSRALTADEVPMLLAAIDDAHYRRYIAALVYTGMRANEATALRIEDVDLAQRTIHVRRAFSIGADGRGVELTPKSHKERDVPIPTPLVAPLTEAMAGKHRGDLVFTGPRGGRINASNVRRAIDWKTLRATLRREDLRIHDLRHTLATMLFDAGASANDVQAVLDHPSSTINLPIRSRWIGVRAALAWDIEGLPRRNGT